MSLPESSAAIPAPRDAGQSPAKRKILVVDDDEEVRRGLRCVLVMEGYEVASASNGREAAEMIRGAAFDLALIDMNMPQLNGWGTIAILRERVPAVPIIIITARPDQRTLARETGVELMEKPLNLPLLLARIAALLPPR